MKIAGFVLKVAVVVLMVIGVTFVGAYLGEIWFGVAGGKFFDPLQQFVITCMLMVIGALLPICGSWSRTELITAVALAQVVVVLVIGSTAGWSSFDWMWRLTRITTLPFAVSVGIGCALATFRSIKAKKG